MVEQVRILRLVVASPGDVQAERDIVPLVVDELNKGIAVDRGLRLEVIRWETDAYPGFHSEGPQGLIDPIVNIEDSDVLIGIFWKRFGSPLKDAQSGTEHEFRCAYESWKLKKRPHIMVYFNQKPYHAESKAETDQWGQVLEFKKNFPREGLWWPYKGRIEFQRLIRHHLTLYVRSYASTIPVPAAPSPVAAPRGSVPPAPGLFIGREEGLRDLKQRLGIASAGRDATPMQPVIAIRGFPGVGKTTMTAALAHDPEVNSAFPHGVLWLPLGEKPSLLSVLARSGRALGSEDLLRALTLKEAIAQFATLLADKRMLLIVDDVWEIEHAVPFQQARGVACALMLTTREPQVAEALAPTPDAVYNLPVLTEENGLRLLRALAPTVVDEQPKESLELVRDLECLPLGLQVAGRLLNEEARMGWGGVDKLLEQLRTGKKLLDAKAPADRMDLEKQTVPTVAVLLNQSTDRLDEHTRDCFARLGAFAPKPATFDLEDMKAVWHVEDPSSTVRTLVNRGLLEPLGGGRFQMHALLVLHADSMLTD